MSSSNTATSTPSSAFDTRGPSRRRYTAEDRRRALAVVGECGGNLTKAAARLGLGVPLLSKWRSEAIRAAVASPAHARSQYGR